MRLGCHELPGFESLADFAVLVVVLPEEKRPFCVLSVSFVCFDAEPQIAV